MGRLERGGSMSRQPDPVPQTLRRLLAKLAAAGLTQEFYLAGGTGLALLVAHRRSVDLDFFSSSNRLDAENRRITLSRLRRLPDWALLEAKDGTLHGRVGRVRVSFFWYEAALVKPLIRQGAVRIASIEDIGLMKIGAIIGRGFRKDFVDLYVICQRVPLIQLLKLGRRKFKDYQDFILPALKALAYVEDAEQDPPIVTTPAVAWEQIKMFFTKEVRALASQHLLHDHAA